MVGVGVGGQAVVLPLQFVVLELSDAYDGQELWCLCC